MNLLAFTDTHGNNSHIKEIERKAKQADVLLCCGDLSIFSSGLSQVMARLNKIGKPLLLIHGNHESEDEMKQISRKFDNIYYAHKRFINIDNYMFVGYGGGGFSRRFIEFDRFIKTMKERRERLSPKKLIFFTHAPPYKTKLDKIYGDHSGNNSISSFIRMFGVDFHFSGHLHENEGVEDKMRKTRLINPGPRGILVDLRD